MTPGLLAVAILGAALTVNTVYLSGGYAAGLREGLVRQLGRALRCVTMVAAVLLLAAYLTKTSDSYSRAWTAFWYCGAAAALVTARFTADAYLGRLRGAGRLSKTVAVVDLCDEGSLAARRIRMGFADDAHLIGVFRPGGRRDVHNGIEQLLALSRLFRVDEVLVLAASADPQEVGAVVQQLSAMPSNVHVCPASASLGTLSFIDFGIVCGIPALTVHRRPFSGLSRDAKRLEDLVISAAAALLLIPVMLGIAALIKLETPGPALFRQARQGFNHNVFTVFKFRTMTHQPEAATQVVQAILGDRRVTKVGRVLRRTSLDELPQLFNVLLGQMSLVGPRPHALAHNQMYETLIDGYIARHKVKPGITGWAQVNGLRGETDTVEKMQRRVQFDLDYIDRWSVLLDLKIIAMTCTTMFFDRQAY